MAFFKLRFPGQSASAEAVTAGPNENIEVVRRRARHRLIGAVVLVLVAVTMSVSKLLTSCSLRWMVLIQRPT